MRVKVSALEFNKDKCFLNGDLFTGGASVWKRLELFVL